LKKVAPNRECARLYKVLIVDDDVFICEDISFALKKDCKDLFEIDKAHNGSDAFKVFQEKHHHIVITDIQMPNPDDGFILLQQIKKVAPETAVMIITGFSDVERAVRAMQLGAVDFVTKPLDSAQIAIKVAKIAERVSLQNDNIRLRNELSSLYELVGNSPAMRDLKKQITMIAGRSDTSGVLITGPNGSGKELVARALVNQSTRADKPFEIVNCAALPENLIESELFGTVKGAFTGATDKKGKFELADGGTIFLDEVGDMTLATQAKVLRVLQNGEFTRLGGEKLIKVNVRVISATNKNLTEMIKQKQFREDLFYRLNVVPLQTTPLKTRAEDIPILIEHMLKRLGKNIEIANLFEPEALAYLKSLEWPGNVRELNNVIERLMIYWNNRPMDLNYIKQYACGSIRSAGFVADISKNMKDASNDFEKEYIRKVLDDCAWNMTEAAKRLGFERPYLYEKIKKLGIEKNE
jgi:two-component system nitrogen regulation response regulator NtrX